jgi:ATP-dependent helicase/nuclease subunit B
VTALDLWRVDAYAFYAQNILALAPWIKGTIEIDSAERGIWLHEVMAAWIKAPQQDEHTLIRIAEKKLRAEGDDPAFLALWLPQFRAFAAAIVAARQQLPAGVQAIETKWQATFACSGVTLKGRPDALLRDGEGTLTLIDYKSGALPTPSQVQQLLRPQLPLLAWLATATGHSPIGRLIYWPLLQDKGLAVIASDVAAIEALATKTAAVIDNFIQRHRTGQWPYTPRAYLPQGERGGRDYQHIIRRAEWAVMTEGEA